MRYFNDNSLSIGKTPLIKLINTKLKLASFTTAFTNRPSIE